MADKKKEQNQDPMTNLSEEERERAIRLLERDAKVKERAKAKRKEMTPEDKAQAQIKNKRRAVEKRLMVKKAKDAGLVVTKEEIDKEMEK